MSRSTSTTALTHYGRFGCASSIRWSTVSSSCVHTDDVQLPIASKSSTTSTTNMTPATLPTSDYSPETHSGEEITSATTTTSVVSHAHVPRIRRRAKRAEYSSKYPSAVTHVSNLRRLSPKADCKIHLANERTFVSW